MKVTLLGDSIRQIGYGTKVPELLGNSFEVFQPNDNCRFIKYILRGLFDWENDMKGSRIVHWNSGLWDICNLFGDGVFTTETEYIENLTRVTDIMLSRYDKVIFATTTPVTKQNPYNSNSDIERFNDIAVSVLKEKGVIINDLYGTVSSDIDKYIRKDDNIHLTEEGIRVCSEQVANIIRKTAEELSDEKTGGKEKSESSHLAGAPV